MKKMKYWNRMLAAVLAASMLAGCGASTTPQATTSAVTEANADDQKTSAAAEETTAAETEKATETAAETTAAAEKTEETSAAEVLTIGEASDEVLRVGSLKGPTTMGLVNLMSEVESGAKSGYSFEMQSQPDVIMSELVSGKLDIALLPANVAAVAYNKTNHGVSAIDINTLGVLYCVTGDENIKSVKDLAGKTVLSTGQGASPEYVLNYLLEKNGVTDCDVQFKSEATEIAALLKQDPAQIAILPQPFVTVATAQNDQLKVAFSLTDEWKSVSPDSKLLTGVTVVRNEVLENRAAEVDQFIADHQASTEKAATDVDATAELVAKYGIIAKAPVAKKALPKCNIVAIAGDELKTDLAGYLQVLFDANPKSVGGTMPDDDFYYIQK
ncbi:ABC transporter substrate-binding protein [Oribacterium sp. HCP3S3_B9]|uniref:ABC transporter substrate-binding protein n=1 Tax=Oribacterium sp. HCP3S3_B9 TaxID=3438946 RepID=UPI003F8B8E4A